jgi:hypothetical protein
MQRIESNGCANQKCEPAMISSGNAACLGASCVLVPTAQSIQHQAGLAGVGGCQGAPDVGGVTLKLGPALAALRDASPLGLSGVVGGQKDAEGDTRYGNSV